MKIYIIGSNGLIGSEVTNFLKNADYSIVTLGRSENNDVYLDLENVDISFFKNLEKDSILIHCAGITDEHLSNNLEFGIRRGTFQLINLVEIAKKASVKKFIYLSTSHVYGDLNKQIDENTIASPKSVYAHLHNFAELYIKSQFLDTLIIRPNAVYGNVGKNFNRWELIPFAFPKAIFDNNQILLKTHGLQYRNFVSSNTIAKIIDESIKKDIVGIINPIGYHNMSILKFAEFCIETINLEYDIKSLIKISIPECDYCNNMKFESTNKIIEEDPDLLKRHILNIYKNLLKK